MRKQIVAGNWKMNKSLQEGKELCSSIINLLGEATREVIIGAPYIHLASLAELTKGTAVKIAAQKLSSRNIGSLYRRDFCGYVSRFRFGLCYSRTFRTQSL